MAATRLRYARRGPRRKRPGNTSLRPAGARAEDGQKEAREVGEGAAGLGAEGGRGPRKVSWIRVRKKRADKGGRKGTGLRDERDKEGRGKEKRTKEETEVAMGRRPLEWLREGCVVLAKAAASRGGGRAVRFAHAARREQTKGDKRRKGERRRDRKREENR